MIEYAIALSPVRQDRAKAGRTRRGLEEERPRERKVRLKVK